MKYWDGQRWHDAIPAAPTTPSAPMATPTKRNRKEVLIAVALGTVVFGGALAANFKDQLSPHPTHSSSGAATTAVQTQEWEKTETALPGALVIQSRQFHADGTSPEATAVVTISGLQPVPPRPYQPVRGALYAVNVYIGVPQGPVTVNPFFFAARTEDGTNLRPTTGVQDMLPATEIPEGQKVSGWLTFDVPNGQHIAEIILSDPLGIQLGRWLVK